MKKEINCPVCHQELPEYLRIDTLDEDSPYDIFSKAGFENGVERGVGILQEIESFAARAKDTLIGLVANRRRIYRERSKSAPKKLK